MAACFGLIAGAKDGLGHRPVGAGRGEQPPTDGDGRRRRRLDGDSRCPLLRLPSRRRSSHRGMIRWKHPQTRHSQLPCTIVKALRMSRRKQGRVRLTKGCIARVCNNPPNSCRSLRFFARRYRRALRTRTLTWTGPPSLSHSWPGAPAQRVGFRSPGSVTVPAPFSQGGGVTGCDATPVAHRCAVRRLSPAAADRRPVLPGRAWSVSVRTTTP